MVLRRRNDRIRLGKTLAQFEYQGKLERMRLPRLEQEEFYRRYSIFEKNTFNRSGSSFYRTKIGNRSWAPKHHSKDKFFRSLNQMKVEKTILTSSKTDIVQTFQKQSKKFILRSSSSNPAFRGVSQKGKTTRLYVSVISEEKEDYLLISSTKGDSTIFITLFGWFSMDFTHTDWLI